MTRIRHLLLFLLSFFSGVVRCRGYVWEPDRNEDEEKKEFITFIAQVEGLSAVPDGRIFMNAYIDAIKGICTTGTGTDYVREGKGLPKICVRSGFFCGILLTLYHVLRASPPSGEMGCLTISPSPQGNPPTPNTHLVQCRFFVSANKVPIG